MNTHTPNDCLAETLPQSESVKAHYAQERVRNAAPELLEALKAMMRHFTIMCNGRWEVMEWVDDERWRSVGPFYDKQEEAETELAILKRDIAASARAAISKATNA